MNVHIKSIYNNNCHEVCILRRLAKSANN